MTAAALVAVAVTAGCTSLMHIRLADVSETALSTLRIQAFRHIHDLSMLHQASEHRGSLVARVTSDVDQISRFMQFAGLMLMINTFQATLALAAMFVYSWQLGLVVALMLPVILATMRWFQTRLDTAYLIVRDGWPSCWAPWPRSWSAPRSSVPTGSKTTHATASTTRSKTTARRR
jgi:ATP-binding cassette, subfamily B, bacterial